jgi:hypothetical protein
LSLFNRRFTFWMPTARTAKFYRIKRKKLVSSAPYGAKMWKSQTLGVCHSL